MKVRTIDHGKKILTKCSTPHKQKNYIPRTIIPSQTANSVYVMKMCQALSKNNFDVNLLFYTDSIIYESPNTSILLLIAYYYES